MRLYRLKYSQRYLCGARSSVSIRSGREAQQKLALRTLFGKKRQTRDAAAEEKKSRVIASLLDLPIDQMTRLVSIWRLWFR